MSPSLNNRITMFSGIYYCLRGRAFPNVFLKDAAHAPSKLILNAWRFYRSLLETVCWCWTFKLIYIPSYTSTSGDVPFDLVRKSFMCAPYMDDTWQAIFLGIEFWYGHLTWSFWQGYRYAVCLSLIMNFRRLVMFPFLPKKWTGNIFSNRIFGQWNKTYIEYSIAIGKQCSTMGDYLSYWPVESFRSRPWTHSTPHPSPTKCPINLVSHR